MALFSDRIMQNLGITSQEIPIGLHYGNAAPTPKLYFQSKVSPSDWILRARECLVDQSGAGDSFRSSFERHSSGRWLGFGEQTTPQALASGLITEAVKAFENAEGGLDTHFSRSAPVLSAVGASFSVGRVIMGHPKAAIYRPKAKLPPKKISLSLSVSAAVDSKDIARSMSKIAKAAWEYSMAGGIIDLEVSFACAFQKAQVWNGKKHYGLIDTLKINPSNAASYATAASGQWFRGFSIPLMQALSGQAGGHDMLQCVNWAKPGLVQIRGMMQDTDEVLKALKVR